MKIFQLLLIISFLISYSLPVKAEIAVSILKPIRLVDTEIQGSIKRQEIEGIFDLDVYMGGNHTKGVELTNPKNETEKKIVSTCREYDSLKKAGWLAYTAVNQSMESFFKNTCGILNMAALSVSSNSSRFGKPPYHMDRLDLYPAMILDEITFGDGSLCKGAKTLLKCAKQRNGKIELKDNRLNFTDEGDEAFFTPALKGDLNKDGYEDMVFTYAYYVIGGTYRIYDMICLEWPEGQNMISVFDCPVSK
jgi:hypothetical protein